MVLQDFKVGLRKGSDEFLGFNCCEARRVRNFVNTQLCVIKMMLLSVCAW